MPTPTNKAIFAPQYYGSVYYYAMMASCSDAIIDLDMRYDKRFKSVHRCTIADVRGELTITVPLSRTPGQSIRRWQQMNVSSHGQWWADHRVSLESAYGRTPYFEFYIDRFLPFLSDTNVPVTDFDREIDRVVRRTLGITAEVTYTTEGLDKSLYIDCRDNVFSQMTDIPYYQVRADRLGFIPGLSILDLIFNMGPEAPLILHKMMGCQA